MDKNLQVHHDNVDLPVASPADHLHATRARKGRRDPELEVDVQLFGVASAKGSLNVVRAVVRRGKEVNLGVLDFEDFAEGLAAMLDKAREDRKLIKGVTGLDEHPMPQPEVDRARVPKTSA